MPIMDFKKETGGEYVVYPAGTYHVRIVSWERVKASTGTQQIRWRAEILTPEDFRGKSMLEHTPLTEASLWRIANFIAALGVDAKECPKMDTDAPVFEAILNACKERTMFWYVKEEVGQNGKLRNSVAEYKLDEEQDIIVPQVDGDLPWE